MWKYQPVHKDMPRIYFKDLIEKKKVDYNGWKTSSNMNLSKTLQACNSSESFCNWKNGIIRTIHIRLDR
jgi:hypothetical protein